MAPSLCVGTKLNSSPPSSLPFRLYLSLTLTFAEFLVLIREELWEEVWMWEQAPSPPLSWPSPAFGAPLGSSRLGSGFCQNGEVRHIWFCLLFAALPFGSGSCTRPFSQCGHSLAAVTHLFGRHSSLQCPGLGEACCWVQFLPLLAGTGRCWAGCFLLT